MQVVRIGHGYWKLMTRWDVPLRRAGDKNGFQPHSGSIDDCRHEKHRPLS